MVGSNSPRKHKSKLQIIRGKSGQSSTTKVIATGRSSNQKKPPLYNKIFYLDLKNHTASHSLQKSLNSLGAKVELFLVKEVNYVVTDRPNWLTSLGSNNTPAPSPFQSQSPVSSVNSPTVSDTKRNKTRAECMLDKVRRQPQQSTLDPLDNAKRWGIHIYSYEKIAASVEKLIARQQQPVAKIVNLKSPYLKFESVKRNCRPTYGELTTWPTINLFGSPGSCPFAPPANKAPVDAKKVASSSCEQAAEHTRETTTHRSTNDKQKTARSVPRMTRTVGRSVAGNCELCNEHYDSLSAHLAGERHQKNAGCDQLYCGLDAIISHGPDMEAFLRQHVDVDNNINSRRSLRTACSLMTPNPVNGLTVRKRPGKAGARTRSMSGGQLYLPSGLLGTTAEDVGNPVRAVHSNSSGADVCSKKRLSGDKSPPAEPRPASECNGVAKSRRRFRARRSQLSVLSDEAQNFMFREPTVHDSSSEASSSDEDADSCDRLNVKIEPDCLDTSGERRRKRRSQAEAFITDNRDYYKFETPGSRLRFHDDKDMELNNKSAIVNNKDKDNNKECVGKVFDVKKVELNGGDEMNSIRDDFTNGISTRGMDGFTFSFEKVPESEPWFQTFQRQDRGEEFYYSNPCSDAPFLLPYELLPVRFPFVGFRGGGRGRGRRGRRRRGHLERKPRKSPRCHASTLAILSGFIQRRKKDPARVKEPVLKVEPPPLPVINPPIRTETDAEMQTLADTLDKALEISGDELELGDVSVDQATSCCGVDVPLASLLDDDCPCCSRFKASGESCALKHVDNWRRRKKKKRKNLTGWPNAKKAKIIHGILLKPALAKDELFSNDFHDFNDDTNESESYTSCDGASERPESREGCERTESDGRDRVTTGRFSSVRTISNNCEVDDDGKLGLPEYCVPNTRRLRSAGTRLVRRESPRKIKN